MRVTPITTNGEYQVTLPMTAPNQLFRISGGAPTLELSTSGGMLRLAWPTAPSGFQLESSDAMLPGIWTPVLITPAVSNAFNHVDAPLQLNKRAQLFRLKK